MNIRDITLTLKQKNNMIDERLSPLLDKLLEISIEFLKENGYDNVDKVKFSAEGLIDGMKYGSNCPSIDNYILLFDEEGEILEEYM